MPSTVPVAQISQLSLLQGCLPGDAAPVLGSSAGFPEQMGPEDVSVPPPLLSLCKREEAH